MEPELASLAIEAVKEALRRGFPIAAKRIDKRAILVFNDRGKGVLYASLVPASEMGEDCNYLVLDSDYVSVWGVKVGVICGGELKEYYPHMVPVAVGHHPHLLSTFEVDVWSRRLSLVDKKLVDAEKYPEILAPFQALGAKVMYLPDTMDYVAKRHNLVLAWFNEFTKKLDDATKFLALMGLL